MNFFIISILVSFITSLLTSLIIMAFHVNMTKKWLADFFDKQDIWLHEHFEDLVRKLFG